ncbi:MAG: TetR family transcriptional regulator [Propionibacteriaceae bacterium]
MTVGPSERKSERTRRAILEAARSQFAARGFDGANLRAIGAEASIDPSMVMRYFGSKEGLFAAAVDVDLLLPDLAAWPSADHGLVLIRHFLRRWEGDLSDHVLVMLMRSALTNDKVAEQLRTRAFEQLHLMLEPVVAPDELDRRAGLVVSQVLGVALTRYILRLPAIADRSAEALITDLAPVVQHYLHGPLPDVESP